jgi:hypothetical protein
MPAACVPRPQALQPVLAAPAENLPLAHSEHAVWPMVALNVPTPQRPLLFALAYVPGLHGWHPSLASTTSLPGGHALMAPLLLYRLCAGTQHADTSIAQGA